MAIYLDCNATTPIEPEVAEIIRFYTEQEFGNAGSRTHEYGVKAKQAVQKARTQIASVIDGVDISDIIFTSGATESNNISILGLLNWAKKNEKKHIVTTAIEHKSVLAPIAYAESLGFKVSYVNSTKSGVVLAEDVLSAIREDTFLVSVMHINNETGIIQPISKIAEGLHKQDCFFHVDAAQGFGKELNELNHSRIDLISISGHKIYGPKGVGALIIRRRKFKRPPLFPIQFGGGQERGLRPGTLPVPLISGFGLAAELCRKNQAKRTKVNSSFRKKLFQSLEGLNYEINGDKFLSIPHTANLSFNGLNSEAVMLVLKGIISVSNGSACTSQNYEPSHVLESMGFSEERIQSAIRFSWCHMTNEPNWNLILNKIHSLL